MQVKVMLKMKDGSEHEQTIMASDEADFAKQMDSISEQLQTSGIVGWRRVGTTGKAQPKLYATDVNFAAWNSMDKATRVKCVEDVGYPTGFAKQWAERDFTSLPADIKAGLLANGYFKQFVAEQNPVQFASGTDFVPSYESEWDALGEGKRAALLKKWGWGAAFAEAAAKRAYKDLASNDDVIAAITTKEWSRFSAKFSAFDDSVIAARDAIKSGSVESAVRAMLKERGLDENQIREVLAAARSYESKEAVFAAYENDTAVWWNGKSAAEKVGKLKKLFPDEEDADHEEVAAQAWKDLPLPVRRALTELHTRSTYAAANNDTMKPGGRFAADSQREMVKRAVEYKRAGMSNRQMLQELEGEFGVDQDKLVADLEAAGFKFTANNDIMKPGGKFSAKFGGLNEPTARRVWGKLDVGMRGEVLDHAGVGDSYKDFEKMSHWDWDKFDRMQKDKLQRMLENMNLYSAGQTSLNGPGLKQDVVSAVLTNPLAFAGNSSRNQNFDIQKDAFKQGGDHWNKASKEQRVAYLKEIGADVRYADDSWDSIPGSPGGSGSIKHKLLEGGTKFYENFAAGQPTAFVAEPARKKASPADDRWKDSMDRGILEAYDKAGGGEAGLKAVVASGLEPNVERAKSIVERLQKERHGGFASKFSAASEWDGLRPQAREDLMVTDGATPWNSKLVETYSKMKWRELPEDAKSVLKTLFSEFTGTFAAASQAKFTATLPTDDATKPETKEFDTAQEAVQFLAGHGYVNDVSRACIRVEATGKWSAPSGASVERFASKDAEGLPFSDADARKWIRNTLPKGAALDDANVKDAAERMYDEEGWVVHPLARMRQWMQQELHKG